MPVARGKLILDRYQPLGKAGSGGYGTVQVAWDPRIQRKVAIKTIELSETDMLRAVLPGAADSDEPIYDASQLDAPGNAEPTLAFSEEDAEDVLPWEDGTSPWRREPASKPATGEGLHSLAQVPGLDEARTAAMLQDPRIVTVYDVEIQGRTAYLIMEYVEGITLTRLLRDYGDYLSLDIVAAVFDSVAGALQAAHKRGVLHLDIKPDNVLINTKGQVKVTDFGLATLADASGRGTAGGGTIGYMPLEQMRREELDARTDEWSLASISYEMLTGENPFLALTLDAAEAAIEDAELVLPSLCWDNLDSEIDDVVFYGLDPDREERYASVRDFAEEMRKFLGDPEQGAHDLEIIVADALGLLPEIDPDEEASATEDDAAGEAAGAGLLAGLEGRAGGADDASDDAIRMRAAREPGAPIRDRITPRMLDVGGRAFAIFACMAIVIMGVHGAGIAGSSSQMGLIISLVAALVAGVCAAIRPHIGALVAFCLLGASIILDNQIVQGIAIIVVAVVWWWGVARQGVSEANAGLTLPIAGAFGAYAFTPIVAGLALRPLGAACTAVFAAVVGVLLSSLVPSDLAGWQALFFWTSGATGGSLDRLVDLCTTASTWCIVVSWIAAAAVQAAFNLKRSRVLSVLGIVVSAVLMLLGAFGATCFDSNMTAFSINAGYVWPIAVSAVIAAAVVIWVRPPEQLHRPEHGRHRPKAAEK